MAKKMLINVMHPEEARVAIVSDGSLVELDVETAGREQTRGNVYKGVVVRVEPGLQAAFVDIGQKKLGFLQMGEIQPDYWQWRDDLPEEQRNRRPRIQEILRRGQELLVQVEKGERDNKGAALTTFLSLPGRYMVIMPGSDSAGVSRKVENEGDRKKLKEIIAEIGIPEGLGYIIRTEALGKRKSELAKDLQYLMNLSDSIKEKAAESSAPALIYQESNLVIRTIRDYFTADIEEVLVDNKDVYKQARDFFKEIMPKYESRVKLHQEKRPIFSKYQLEEQIDLIYEKKVPLKSGGSIVIDPTEALVSIDVNSGKSTGERGVEDTAFKTNMEAAEEAARQLRLRDLGGLIVIDFIDMRDRKHQTEVEKTLKNALKEDKARVSVGKISQFGLLEMSRQRIKQTINEANYLECPHCGGHGKVKSIEAMALSFLRKAHTVAARGNIAEVLGGLPLDVAYYLLNRKKRELVQIETDYGIEVTVKGKPSFMMNQIEVDLLKKEKGLATETAPETAVLEQETESTTAKPQSATMAASVDGEESKAKRKRRRHKKKPLTDADAVFEETALPEEESEAELPSEGELAAPVQTEATLAQEDGESPASELKKKRRRRRRRSTKPQQTEEGGITDAAEKPDETENVVEETTHAIPEVPAAAEEPTDVKPEKKKPARKKRTVKKAETPQLPVEPEKTEAAEKSVQAPETLHNIEELPGEQPEAAPKKKSRPRKKKEPIPKPDEAPVKDTADDSEPSD
jgi:ribonuclease E